MSEWHLIAKTGDFAQTDRKAVNLGPQRHIAVFKVEAEYFAVGAWCSHEKAQLVIGEVEDHEVICPLHGARFDLRTGRHLSPPALRPVPHYEVKVEGENIYVLL